VPAVADTAAVINSIDNFIIARLEPHNIEPSAPADRVTLIRRVSLDLTGLPPSVEQVDAFLHDDQPDAYERLVDQLLASPHFGERWARHWLDGARYADSDGFNIDAPRTVWPYRDWVIDAFNHDMPFDRFTVAQIAGDLLPDATRHQHIATGFNRNTLHNREGGIDREQFRVERTVDRVNTVGEVFLGLTVGCARCHEHKFDPIAQAEYYRLFAFFNNADESTAEVGSDHDLARAEAVRAQLAALNTELASYTQALDGRREAWLRDLTDSDRASFKPDVRAAIAAPADQRTAEQNRRLTSTHQAQDTGYQQRSAAINDLKKRLPKLETSLVLRERGERRPTTVHIAGDFTRPGDPVEPGVPAVLHDLPKVQNPSRVDLARWLVDPANPLTARVTVNRMWQRFFGRGPVEPSNDFGTQGTPPTHPQLLDWLATEFVARDWSVKEMLRLMVTSATYRQSSYRRDDLAAVDPFNKLLARQRRLRLEAETIRDTALAACNTLCRDVGGPSVFPLQPAGVMALGQMKRPWKVSEGGDRYRRGMYTFFWRATPHPALMVFDAPNSMAACTRRNRSNTPLQALTLLNDGAFVEFARHLAVRVLTSPATYDDERIGLAFRLCLSREPGPTELSRLAELLVQQRAGFQAEPDEAAALLAGDAPPRGIAPTELAAWMSVARVLMNLDEFITRE
jgi:hypothetical protein